MKRFIAIMVSMALLLSLFALPVGAVTVIDEVSVEVVAPTAAKIPSYYSKLAHDSYILDDEVLEYKQGGITWYKDNKQMLPDESFEIGNVYTVRVDLLRANEGYEFPTEPNILAKINGNDAFISYVNQSYLVIEYTFPVIKEETPVSVESVNFRIEGYQDGSAVADAEIISDDDINIDVGEFLEIIDDNNDGEPEKLKQTTGNFSTDKTYGASIRFTAKSGYSLSGLLPEKVSMENSIYEVYETYSEAEDYFYGLYLLEPLQAHKHSMLRIITPATTKGAGKIQHFCEFCDENYVETVAKIKDVKISKTSYTYDGKVKKPSVTVVDTKGKKLVAGKDYSVKYSSGRKNVGKYTVTVTFSNNYSGKVLKSFTIVPKSTKVKSLAKGTKKITVKWNKQITQTTGYQIQYGTKSSFKGAKTVTVAKNKTTSKTISRLKAKTKYYVRIRTYKTAGGKKYYSLWSASKNVKTK